MSLHLAATIRCDNYDSVGCQCPAMANIGVKFTVRYTDLINVPELEPELPEGWAFSEEYGLVRCPDHARGW